MHMNTKVGGTPTSHFLVTTFAKAASRSVLKHGRESRTRHILLISSNDVTERVVQVPSVNVFFVGVPTIKAALSSAFALLFHYSPSTPPSTPLSVRSATTSAAFLRGSARLEHHGKRVGAACGHAPPRKRNKRRPEEMVSKGITVRTSESHPITLSWILEHQGGGRLGLCYCPGKQVQRSGVTWERTLDKDLTRLQQVYGITTLACLLNGAELNCFKLRNYGPLVEATGMELLLFPIIEMAPPDSLPLTKEFVRSIIVRLEKGENVAVHCRGGVGRAGVIAACVLLEMGLARTGRRAIEEVRKLRCARAVESYRQERFVCDFALATVKGGRKSLVPEEKLSIGRGQARNKLFDCQRDWKVLGEAQKLQQVRQVQKA